jgi:hypothetical protein
VPTGTDPKQKKSKTYKNKKMKRFFLSIATVLTMTAGAFAANGNTNTNSTEDNVNQQVITSFKKDFAAASNIVWEQKAGYSKATFSLNGEILFAYYDSNGELTAVVRNITSEQLPINLLASLKRDYDGYWISDLFEVASGDQTTYYVTLENSDKKLVMRAGGNDFWDVYSKEKK